MVQLEKNVGSQIPPKDLLDGEIAEIIYMKTYPEKVGKIVQRVGNRLVTIGESKGKSWADCSYWEDETCFVRKLESGEKIIINQ